MKIRSLTLKNIGVFEDTTIEFPEKKNDGAEIHILTGENGTGKTTILQALACGMSHTYLFETIKNLNNISFVKKFHKENLEDEIPPQFIISFENHTIGITSDGENILFGQSKIETQQNKNLEFSAFAYSGYRFIDHQENINIKEKENYNPLENALEFNKINDKNDYSLNEWLANRMAQRNSAFFEGNKEDVEKYSKSIENLKKIIEEIIENPIDFKFKNEKLKVVAVKDNIELDFDLLPDGLRSIISWIGDLLMRMDALKWENDLPVFEREFILFLDEIEVHLHPKWQRKILPVVQKLFKNAQIFITTHSPFIVNSVDGAWVYDLEFVINKVICKEPILSKTSDSIDYILRKVFGVHEKYGQSTQEKIEEFYKYRTELMNGNKTNKSKFEDKVHELLALNDRSIEDKVHFELAQLGEEYSI